MKRSSDDRSQSMNFGIRKRGWARDYNRLRYRLAVIEKATQHLTDKYLGRIMAGYRMSCVI